ncbi:class I SAM-dependent methyltransferase [Mycobacterium sp. M1]|uniref:Class I SAM-dependent methyltransferase n=1 Tax=Mycolicibacter acidiphilus TaxID=2835306 RepID=A0ABS5RJ35_9MYCO|nr:class I SAM-dependent methyltransferase [Mycolicibacter acidiphilus]MBS9532954.1 class I SAM-dependent methyltransferase [Mycolicibacter acidiphilus]
MSDGGFIDHTRAGYDRIAEPYADRFHDHLRDKPVDQAMLRAFAGLVAATGNDRVADVGCGTGATTVLLRDLGADAVGIDLSPNMIRLARRLNPDIRFTVGCMTSIDAADAGFGGVCAWYSIIHTPDDRLQPVFDEFSRVLIDGGLLLLAFQVGDRPRILREAFGEPVDLTFHRRTPEFVATLLAQANLRVHSRLIREPEGTESTPQAYLIARKAL